MATIDIKSFREKVIKNCYDLTEAAKSNFEQRIYPISAFLSIMAIEEISRIWFVLKFINFKQDLKVHRNDMDSLVRLSQSLLEKKKSKSAMAAICKRAKILRILGPYDIVEKDVKEIKNFFDSHPSRSHVMKQELAILSSLTVNSRAYRRLGPAIIDKYMNMAKTGRLFDLRNQCLYTYVVKDSLLTPSEVISEEDALELVCLAMEVVAETSDFGAAFLDDEYNKQVTDWWLSFTREADAFQKKHNLIPKKVVGRVTNYLSRIGVAIIDVTDDININDEVVIKGPKTALVQKITSIEINHKKVNSAKANFQVGVKVDEPVRKKDLVYKTIKS
jgi:AbiV family abortive infection protein